MTPANGNSLNAAVLDRRFTYHPPQGDQPHRYETIRSQGRMFADLLLASCPPSRELTVALERLDEVVFWANASIARNEV